MATTLSTLAQYLDNYDLTYQVDSENERIIFGGKGENIENLWIVIRLCENGEFIQLIAPEILNVQDHIYKSVLFQTLLIIQWELKMLRFAYDPSDGEIMASIQLPIEDSTLTEKQFFRALQSLVRMVDKTAMPRLKTVLATGKDPGKQKLVDELLTSLSPEVVSLLEEAIMARRQQ